jgi:hypothetical protein
MARTSTIANMSEHELESFINVKCIPQFVSRMEEYQVKAIEANSNASREILRESAQTIFSEVVRDQLHRSYPTAELALVTTFRKCLEEAVLEIGKVIERNTEGELNGKTGEERAGLAVQVDNPSPPSQEFPSLYRGWNEEHSKGADRTLGSALQELQKGVAEMIAEGEENTNASEAEGPPVNIEFRVGLLPRPQAMEEHGQVQGSGENPIRIFEMEGEMSNLTTPNLGPPMLETEDTVPETQEEGDTVVPASVEEEKSSIQTQEQVKEAPMVGEVEQSVVGRTVDESNPPPAPMKRYNTRSTNSKQDVSPTALDVEGEDENSEHMECGRVSRKDEQVATVRKRSTSKNKDPTMGHDQITNFFSPKE